MDSAYKTVIKELVDETSGWLDKPARLEQGKMTTNGLSYKKLFEPIIINRLKIKNRIVMGPMGNISMADETGKPSEKMIQYFIERAKGGVGLITSGMIPVDPTDDPSIEDLHHTGIFPRLSHHRSTYTGWRSIVEGCHAFGAKFFIQLSPGMGRVGNPECLIKKRKLPVSSSWNPNWYMPEIPCRRLSDHACKKIIKHTAQLALDAKELGIDGVFLHGHSGYFIEQMTDPAFNRRKIGSYKDYERFGIDLVKAIREKCGKNYPIHYRIDLSLALHEIYGQRLLEEKSLRKFKAGRDVLMTLNYMEKLVEVGVDIFDVDAGGYENWWLPHPPNTMPPGLYLGLASLVKEHFAHKKIVTQTGHPVPIIAVGKLGYPDLAEKALVENKCDMIMLARPLLADPYWPQKVFEGKVEEIRPCIGDHEGCLAQLAIGGHPHCAVNPRAAFEHIYSKELPPATKEKKIAVIGAGPAGVMLACTLAERHHEVDLFEKSHKVGGTLRHASVPKIKYDLANYLAYMKERINRVSSEHKLNCYFDKGIDVKDLEGKGYEAVITCTGAKPLIPPITGVGHPHVITYKQFLKDPQALESEKRSVVIGGSDVGCEVAHMLSYEMGHHVTIVEIEPYLMKKTCTSNRNAMIYYLHKKGVNIMNCAQVKHITKTEVMIDHNVSSTVPDPTMTWKPLLPDNVPNPLAKKIKVHIEEKRVQADYVIMCTGVIARSDLYDKLVTAKVAPEIYNIGDSSVPGRVLEAVKAGYRLGRHI